MAPLKLLGLACHESHTSECRAVAEDNAALPCSVGCVEFTAAV